MDKGTIKLNEDQLKNFIKESVTGILAKMYEERNSSEYKDEYVDSRSGDVMQSRTGENGEKHFRVVKGKKKSDDSDKSGYKDAYVDSRSGDVMQSRTGENGEKHYRTVKTKKLNESQLLALISESVKRVLKEMDEDLFVPFRTNGGEDIIDVTPLSFSEVMKGIRGGEYDEFIKKFRSNFEEGWDFWKDHIDISAQNMDTASDLYIDVTNALKERASLI